MGYIPDLYITCYICGVHTHRQLTPSHHTTPLNHSGVCLCDLVWSSVKWSALYSPVSLVACLIGPPSHWSPSHWYWSPVSLVPHPIGPPSHWFPLSLVLVPHLTGPPSHWYWSPVSLVPHPIGPPSHWFPLSLVLVPHLTGPPSHWYWSPVSLVPHLIAPRGPLSLVVTAPNSRGTNEMGDQ